MSNLLDATRDLLEAVTSRETSLRAIARGAGPPVEYDWLKRFAAGDIDDPSVNRIQHLHDHLLTLKHNGAAKTRVAG